MYEILIVGGGPAGLTAAIYAARAGKHVAVLERGSTGGQIISAPLVENYPGIPSVSGTELARQMTEQACTFGAEIVYTEAVGLEKTPAGFRVLCMASGRQKRSSLRLVRRTGHWGLRRRLRLPAAAYPTALSATARFMRDWTLRSWAAEIRPCRTRCFWQTSAAA